MNKNLSWNTHGKHYNTVWSSKLLAITWLGNIINAMYVHFWLPILKKEILQNPIPEKYGLQFCSVGQTKTKVEVFPSYHKSGNLNSKSCWREFSLGLEVFKTFELLGTMWIRNGSCLLKKNSRIQENDWMTIQNNISH